MERFTESILKVALTTMQKYVDGDNFLEKTQAVVDESMEAFGLFMAFSYAAEVWHNKRY